jgi:hypothetical protein
MPGPFRVGPRRGKLRTGVASRSDDGSIIRRGDSGDGRGALQRSMAFRSAWPGCGAGTELGYAGQTETSGRSLVVAEPWSFGFTMGKL